MRRLRSRSEVWTAPIALAVLSGVGLVSALASDGIGDVVAWVALGVPVVVVAWYSRGRTR